MTLACCASSLALRCSQLSFERGSNPASHRCTRLLRSATTARSAFLRSSANSWSASIRNENETATCLVDGLAHLGGCREHRVHERFRERTHRLLRNSFPCTCQKNLELAERSSDGLLRVQCLQHCFHLLEVDNVAPDLAKDIVARDFDGISSCDQSIRVFRPCVVLGTVHGVNLVFDQLDLHIVPILSRELPVCCHEWRLRHLAVERAEQIDQSHHDAVRPQQVLSVCFATIAFGWVVTVLARS